MLHSFPIIILVPGTCVGCESFARSNAAVLLVWFVIDRFQNTVILRLDSANINEKDFNIYKGLVIIYEHSVTKTHLASTFLYLQAPAK